MRGRVTLAMRDVGVDGFSFMARRPVSPGTRLQMSFELPAVPAVHVDATAISLYSSYEGADGFRIGARFLDLPDAAADAIAAFVAQQ